MISSDGASPGSSGDPVLVPLLGLGRLVSRDPRPLRPDRVTRAIRAVKHAPKVTDDMLADLRAVGGVSAQLVCLSVDWSPGFPSMTYAVEKYSLERPRRALTLHRYADDDQGVWWADTAMAARLHGQEFHDAPQLWKRTFEPEQILAKMRTRFGRQLSPPEYIVDVD